MIISYEQMQDINAVQTDILRDVAAVCEALNIRFYMVHGSLLGTIRDHRFVRGDDDIDIAFFRKDYELFLREAPKHLPRHLFVQSNTSEETYPLEFAKVRDSRTTYIIEIARHLPMNHGIYIDVFPIDYYPICGKWRQRLLNWKRKLLKIRVKSVWKLGKESFVKRLANAAACLYCPSVKTAVKKIDKMLKKPEQGELVRVSGGKGREQGIPRAWFDEAREDEFEGVKVYIPGGYKEYLTAIYGDYTTRTLLEDKEADDQGVDINACVVDTQTPYTAYVT